MATLTNNASSAQRTTFPPVADQLELLMRGVEYGDAELQRAMTAELTDRLGSAQRSGVPLRAYVGVDPTGSDLTLGHTVPLRKLRQFQELGHQAIFVIGDFTARIGDPSDKDTARRQLTSDEVATHAAHYVTQAMRVLDPRLTEVRHNSHWLAELDFAALIDLAAHFTVGQFLQRDNFRQRFEAGDAIWLHEFFYALMQAYDALVIRADVQIGGTEQLFNLMAGRKLQQARGQPPQVPVTMPILVGTDGAQRMSKSTGNYIALAEAPEEQYGKTMSLPDHAMPNWFNLVTSLAPSEIERLLGAVADGQVHPMEAKKTLAREIVTLFHDATAAGRAADHFERTVQHGDLPAHIPTWVLRERQGLLDLLAETGLAASNSEARRLVVQGGVRIDGRRVDDAGTVLEPGHEHLIQVGKRRFLRVADDSA